MKKLKDFTQYSPQTVKQLLIQNFLAPFRDSQVRNWYFKKFISNFNKMTDLSKNARIFFKKNFYLPCLKIIDCQKSKNDFTTKYLFKTDDMHYIEAALLKYKSYNTACLSTQIGCKFRCRFCANSLMPFVRNLESHEIIGQYTSIAALEPINRIVFMGIGEPLDNFENLKKSIKIFLDNNKFNIGCRRITISTCGIPEKIKKLAEEDFNVNLALSIHSFKEEKRKFLMPVAGKFPLKEIFMAAKYYADKKKRRISIEYCLIHNLNDTEEDINLIVKFARKFKFHVNLITYNKIKNLNFKPSKRAEYILKKLKQNNIKATLRRKLGSEINAACGQLRYSKQKS